MHVKTAARALLRMGQELDKKQDYRNADFVTRIATALLQQPQENITNPEFDKMYEAQKRIESNGGMQSYERSPEAKSDEIYPGVPLDQERLKQRALKDPRIPTDNNGRPLQGLKNPGWESYNQQLPESMFLSLDQIRQQIEGMTPEQKTNLLLSEERKMKIEQQRLKKQREQTAGA